MVAVFYSILKSWHKSRQNIRERENNNWIDLSSIIRQEPRQHTHLIKIYRQNWLTDRADNGQSVLSIVKRWRDTRRNGWEYEAEQWTTQLTMAAVIRREPWLYTHLMKRVNRHNQQTDRTGDGLSVLSIMNRWRETRRNACENARLNNEQPNRRWRQSSEESLDSTLT